MHIANGVHSLVLANMGLSLVRINDNNGLEQKG
jgi:hypothetical protein